MNSPKAGVIAAFAIMLLLAFLQCYHTVHDLHWAYDPDFDRDIAFARGLLEGHYGQDPNYQGAWLWYNPLLFTTEAVIHKLTNLPLNVIAAQAGIYLNLLGPIFFFLMVKRLFDYRIALAAVLFFLFINSGNVRCWGAATYSPWLFPVCFSQFLFYIGIIVCYKAYTSQKYGWFFALGASIGTCFLSHTAPSLLLILLMAILTSRNLIAALKQKDRSAAKRSVLQGIAAALTFIIVAFPLLYYVVGKYHLHMINRETFEYTEGMFYIGNFMDLVKANINMSLAFAIIGFIYFYREVKQPVVRTILSSWLLLSVSLYGWATFVAGMDHRYGIKLPGTVPSFHYFFYFKSIQSIFSGLGFIWVITPVLRWIASRIKTQKPTEKITNALFIAASLLFAFAYYPVYAKRPDFVLGRGEFQSKEALKDDIAVYEYIVRNIPSDKVFLTEQDYTMFPIMATSRKAVCNNITFSNPYYDYAEREKAQTVMLTYLRTGNDPAEAVKFFTSYDVSYVLLSNKELQRYKAPSTALGEPLLKNNTFTLFPVNRQSLSEIKKN